MYEYFSSTRNYVSLNRIHIKAELNAITRVKENLKNEIKTTWWYLEDIKGKKVASGISREIESVGIWCFRWHPSKDGDIFCICNELLSSISSTGCRILFFKNAYLFILRERVLVQVWAGEGAEREETDRENPKKALHRANCKIMMWAEIKIWMLNQLSHPGISRI